LAAKNIPAIEAASNVTSTCVGAHEWPPFDYGPLDKEFEHRISDARLSTLHKLRRTLDAVGVEFIDPDAKLDEGGAGVRLRTEKKRR
jgi:hypothetical protein